VAVPKDDMPSWVARWESGHAIASPIINAEDWPATGDKALDIKILKKQCAFKIKGLYFDNVTYCSDIFQNSNCIPDDEEILAQKPTPAYGSSSPRIGTKIPRAIP
jgi:hypothetical protein